MSCVNQHIIVQNVIIVVKFDKYLLLRENTKPFSNLPSFCYSEDQPLGYYRFNEFKCLF